MRLRVAAQTELTALVSDGKSAAATAESSEQASKEGAVTIGVSDSAASATAAAASSAAASPAASSAAAEPEPAPGAAKVAFCTPRCLAFSVAVTRDRVVLNGRSVCDAQPSAIR